MLLLNIESPGDTDRKPENADIVSVVSANTIESAGAPVAIAVLKYTMDGIHRKFICKEGILSDHDLLSMQQGAEY